MFAIITPALISGAIARDEVQSHYHSSYILWSTIAYDLVATGYGEWGVAARMGALDFAGGTVVHVTRVVGRFVATLSPEGLSAQSSPPQHGLLLSWVGECFGSDGSGSSRERLGSSATATVAFVATTPPQHRGCLAGCCWNIPERKADCRRSNHGSVAGLVAITPNLYPRSRRWLSRLICYWTLNHRTNAPRRYS